MLCVILYVRCHSPFLFHFFFSIFCFLFCTNIKYLCNMISRFMNNISLLQYLFCFVCFFALCILLCIIIVYHFCCFTHYHNRSYSTLTLCSWNAQHVSSNFFPVFHIFQFYTYHIYIYYITFMKNVQNRMLHLLVQYLGTCGNFLILVCIKFSILYNLNRLFYMWHTYNISIGI